MKYFENKSKLILIQYLIPITLNSKRNTDPDLSILHIPSKYNDVANVAED